MGAKLVLNSADFSESCIEGIDKYILLNSMDITIVGVKDTYIKLLDGTETGLQGFNISEFIDIPENSNMINGYANSQATAATVAFYDSEGTYLSGLNTIYKVDYEEGGISKGYFSYDIPLEAKKIKVCWAYNRPIGEANVDVPNIKFVKKINAVVE